MIVITALGTTFCRDLSYNKLSGDVPTNGSFSLFTPIRYYHLLYNFLLAFILAASDVLWMLGWFLSEIINYQVCVCWHSGILVIIFFYEYLINSVKCLVLCLGDINFEHLRAFLYEETEWPWISLNCISVICASVRPSRLIYLSLRIIMFVFHLKDLTVMCSFLGNNDLCGSVVGKQCPGQPPFPPPPPFTPPPPANVNGQQGMN